MEATITAAYVNQPKPTKKNGTVKGADDVLWLAKPPVLAQMQQGGQYKIVYDEYTIGGNTFKEIKEVTQISAPSAPAGQGYSRGSQQDDGLPERIFVCGAVNSTLSNSQINPADIVSKDLGTRLVAYWRDVWAKTFGARSNVVPLKQPTSKDDMNDEIPW